MVEVTLFGEDYGHERVIGALIGGIAAEFGIEAQLNWRSAVQGHGRVVRELRRYLEELEENAGPYPDLLVVATDANCLGANERRREFQIFNPPRPLILATPDPHVERWLLLDGAAFNQVFGRGCQAPTYKCGRDEYKRLLIESIRETGVRPELGGIEFAADLVQAMDIDRAARADPSLQAFVNDLRSFFSNP